MFDIQFDKDNKLTVLYNSAGIYYATLIKVVAFSVPKLTSYTERILRLNPKLEAARTSGARCGF
jgi:hypothetical protein